MRVLFFNEGNLGSHVLGHGQLDEALRAGLACNPEIEADFVDLGPMGRWATALATRAVPGLRAMELDVPALRWHLVQSARTRSRLAHALAHWPADFVHLHSQSVALFEPGHGGTAPLVLSVDATIRDWSEMPAWPPSARRRTLDFRPSMALERRALRRASLVLAWTAWARAGVERDAPGARVLQHHPGVDLQRYRPAPRIERERPRVLFVGGRFADKGGEDLLAALSPDLGVTVELDIVTPTAEVPQRPGVRVHRLAPGDPRLLDMQQQADVLCLPTRADTNPWAVLEAMACATPVLSTPVGAISELLDDGRAGVLVPHSNPRALRGALLSLLDDPGRRVQLAGAGRAQCERRYDATRQFAGLLEHLRGLARPG